MPRFSVVFPVLLGAGLLRAGLLRTGLLGVGALLLAAAGEPPAAPAAVAAGTVVAQRGDMKLTAGDVRDLVAKSDATVRDTLQANPAALAEFVRDRLLKQSILIEAHTTGFEQTPDVQARVAEARDAAIVAAYVTSLTRGDPGYPSQDQVTAAYEGNHQRFMLPRQYHVEQIAARVAPGATQEADDAAAAKIREIRIQVLKPKADFADIARKQSDEPMSAERGGDLGWLREDQLVPAVREAVASLKDGAISEPVHTQDGWHLLKLIGTRPAGIAPLADVRDSIVQAMRQSRAQAAARSYVDAMLKKEPIQLNEIELSRSLRLTN